MVSILLYHRTNFSQKGEGSRTTRPDGLIDKNPSSNLANLCSPILAERKNLKVSFLKLRVLPKAQLFLPPGKLPVAAPGDIGVIDCKAVVEGIQAM